MKITDLDKMKIEEQKKAVRSGYDMDIIPSDLATFGGEAKRLLQDLQTRNERLFLVTILIMNTATSRQKLENAVFQTAAIAQKYNCALKRLDFQQEEGLMSSLPIGVNQVEIERGLTTSSTAVFVPFTTQELFQGGEALYYGLNALSNNMIMVDRKRLKNPNGLILGTPGSGKSFSAKREMTNAFLITEDDIIVCDPEAEYFPLVQKLGGQVIRISPVSTDYINPLDINTNYSEEENPLTLKSDFILSMCELIVGGKDGLQPVEKTIIDRSVRMVYQEFLADPKPEKMPILEDLYNILRNQKEPEAQRIATALEIYVHGSLNVFNHRTNVDVNNRFVCYDIRELGKQLKKLGMLIVQDQVWNRVTINRAQHKATRYYMDEFHLLLKEEQTAAYSVEIWKRFRKWGGIPTGITQNVKDLLASREVENIFENSDFVYLLNQASGDREILSKALNISPSQQNYITNSNAGEGLIFYGSTQQIYAVQYELVYDQNIPAGSIIRHVPGEGEQVSRYGAVYFTVSLGQEQRTVPDVLYKKQADAQKLFASRGFGWTLYDRIYSYVQIGNVAAQSPEGGKTAAPASQISLEISASAEGVHPQLNELTTTMKSLELEVGQTYDLDAAMQKTDGAVGTIVWSSGNPRIASVDENGVITSAAPGTVNITAVLNGCAASCFVTVRDSRPFSLPETIYILEGESRDLAEDWDIPAENVTWSVWDGQCMRIDERGVLTGLSPCVSYVCAVYDGRMARSKVIVQDAENCAKVRRFTESTTQQEAEEALRAAGVEFTTTKVSSSVPSGCVADFEFVGHEDDEYYYIGRRNKTKLMISAGVAQKPAGKATLSVLTPGTKTVYYMGDKADTAGVSLQYKDANGKTQTITSGFTASFEPYDKNITLTYQGLKASYPVTVKSPSISINKKELKTGESIKNGVKMTATYEPSYAQVTWSSSNTKVAYFDGDVLYFVGPGTTTIHAKVKNYNCESEDTWRIQALEKNTQYVDNNTDHVDKNVEPEYSFHITALAGGSYNAAYDIESTIPGIQKSKVSWTVTPSKDVDYFHDGDFFNVARTADCTITASYVYNGRTYTDTYRQKGVAVKEDTNQMPEETSYEFWVERSSGGAYNAYTVKTDIPGFSTGNVVWSVSPADTDWFKEGAAVYIYVDKNAACTVTASYTYNGKTYTGALKQNYAELY